MSWRILPLMMLFVALAHFNRVSITVAGAEEIIRPGFISKTEMGFVYSAYLVSYTLFMVVGGWFIDRSGPRAAWMVVGFGSVLFVTLMGVVGLLWTGAVALWWGLFLVRVMQGIVSAPLHPTGARLVGNWIPPSEARLANGLVTSAACLGVASTYIVFGFLIDQVGWQCAFLVSGGITLVMALTWTTLGANHPPGTASVKTARRSSPPTFGRVVQLLKHRSLLCLTLSYGLVGYFEYLFFYWSEFYFEKEVGLSQQTSRSYATIGTLSMGAGMALGGWFADRALVKVGARRGFAIAPVFGLLAGAAAILLALVPENPIAILAWLSLAMAAVGLTEGSYWTAAVRVGGAHAGTAAGILNTGGNAIGLLAPVLTPYLSDLIGWKRALGVAAVVSLFAAVLWLPIRLEPAEGETGHTGEKAEGSNQSNS